MNAEAQKAPDLTPPTKGAAKPAKEAKAPKAPKAEGEGKGSANPRPRKWDYGIVPEAKIVRTAEAEKATMRKDMEKEFAATAGDPTVEAFFKAGGTRHGLRVLSRRGVINILHADGNTFPKKL